MTIKPPTLLLFAKLPGKVPCKTRLASDTSLAPEQIELLARSFLADTLHTMLATAKAVGCGLAFATEPAAEADEIANILSGLADPVAEDAFSEFWTFPQNGANFGQRLQHALTSVYGKFGTGAVVIGSDSPTLAASILSQALEACASGNCVLGPTPEGGIYAIGVPQSLFATDFSLADVFSDSKQTELEALAQRMHASGTHLSLLECHYDVDVAADLVTLRSLLTALKCSESSAKWNYPENTAAVINALNLEFIRHAKDTRQTSIREISSDAAK